MNYRTILFLAAVWIGLTGCNPRIEPVQSYQTDLVSLDAQISVGQTFVAHFDGLNAVTVSLSPNKPGNGNLRLHLRAEPSSSQDLGVAVMPLNDVTIPGTYRFDFAPITRSNQGYYYALLEVEGNGSLWVGASAGNTYLDGAMYQDGAPQDGQLTFLLEYDGSALFLGLAREVIKWLEVLGAALLVYLIPGWALLACLWHGWDRLRWPEKFGLSAGMSLALGALLMLYTDLIGLHLGAAYAWGPALVGIGGLIWNGVANGGLKRRFQVIDQWIRHPRFTLNTRLSDISLVILLGLIIVLRFWAIRELEAPMWGDSVHHTYITQLVLDAGGLFESWEPYAPYTTFSNQYGFPAAAALLAWVIGMPASQAVFYSGQILNVLAIVAILPLALRLANGQGWAGVGMVFAAGLLSSMPAYYVNWGRYAQLAGQVVLPVVLWMLVDVVGSFQDSCDSKRVRRLPWLNLILAGAALGGMVLYQYRTPFFFLAFILACVMGWWLPVWRFNFRRWWEAGMRVGLVILIGIVLFLPWGVRLTNGSVGDLATADTSGNTLYEGIRGDYQAWKNLLGYVPLILAVGAIAGWLLGLGKRAWLVITIGMWIGWMASIQAWTLIGVPGALQVSSFSVLISLYLPLSLLFGWLIGQFAGMVERWPRAEIGLVCIFLVSGVWFAWEQRNLANPESSAMVTRPDMRAMSWIREQTDPEVRFLVEGFSAFFDTTAVGSDAGWWIPLLADRENTMPPLYALSSEVPLQAGYSERVINLVVALETVTLNSIEGSELLCDEGITHIYIGQQQGLVGITWVEQSFAPEELLDQPYYDLVYHQDRVYIFALKPGICLQ